VEDNIKIKNGRLNLLTKYEPNTKKHFPHLDSSGDPIIDDDCDCIYEKYTTAGVVSREGFLYGYFEVRAKIADASLSSAFWVIGDCHEIDVFETIGSKNKRNSVASCTHYDYRKDGFCKSTQVANDFNPTAEFHVFGAEWDPQLVKVFVDGQLLHTLPRTGALAAGQWPPPNILKNGNCVQHIWFSNEAFSWEGFPNPADLPKVYSIDYVRVWQRASLCKDDAEWYFGSVTTHTCSGWVAMDKSRCDLFSKGYVKDRCPKTCGRCQGANVPTKSPVALKPYKIHRNKGWCNSGNQLENPNIKSYIQCWTECSNQQYLYVEWFKKVCFCQKTCPCMSDTSVNGRVTLVPRNFKLPKNCCRDRKLKFKNNPKKNCEWAESNNKCPRGKYKKKKIRDYWCPKTCGWCTL